MSTSSRKRVIVVGGGFAGMNLARGLEGVAVDVTIVDRHNYHLFQPLLYQVATAALSPADIAYPIRHIFAKQMNVNVVLGAIDRIDLGQRQVFRGEVCAGFDYLALCVGSTHSYFGHENEWRPRAPGLKDLDDATDIRRRVLLAFEEAELERDEKSRRAKLTFVIVGGGPTGVEMAGALREIAANDIQKDFRHIDTSMSRIILLEGGPRLLPAFDPVLGKRAKRDLEGMGVDVRLNATVTDVDWQGVTANGEHLHAQTIIWAAGVAAPEMLSTLGVPTDKTHRVSVKPDLSIEGYPNVFVLGDAAKLNDPKTGKPVPGLAPAAIQMGKYVAKVIRAEVESDGSTAVDRKPFHYVDKGTLATIGTHRAVADVRGWRFGGTFAWLMWGAVHIAFLIGFRNRTFVMIGWIYQYIFRGREARLITGTSPVQVSDPRQQ